MSMSSKAASILVRYQGWLARQSSMSAGSWPCRAYQMMIRVWTRSAKGTGRSTARLTIAYLKCPDTAAGPCSYEVDVNVVQFPKAEATIDNVYMQTTVKLHVGETVRFSAPYESDPLWTLTIDSPDVVKWAVEPIYLSQSMFEAAVTAVSAGTAHLQAGQCSSSAPVCSNPWRLTFVVT